jgi:hypothetical protein
LGCHLPVEVVADIQIEYKTQKVPLISLKTAHLATLIIPPWIFLL